jgi:hypothetical protein
LIALCSGGSELLLSWVIEHVDDATLVEIGRLGSLPQHSGVHAEGACREGNFCLGDPEDEQRRGWDVVWRLVGWLDYSIEALKHVADVFGLFVNHSSTLSHCYL